jgi:PIN domain nuclease of toxin-antitoxin system
LILDAHAVLAFLRDEPAAPDVEALLLDHIDAALTPVGVAQVLDRLIRLGGVDEEEAALDLAQLGLADPAPLSAAVASAAGRLRAGRYHRTHCAVSLADCIAAESARVRRCPLATSDPHLLELCTAEGIAVEILPDSSGRRWQQGS